MIGNVATEVTRLQALYFNNLTFLLGLVLIPEKPLNGAKPY